MSDTPARQLRLMRPMSTHEAMREAVLAFGVAELANLLAMTEKRLRNKIDPNDHAHPLLLREATGWSKLMGSTLALEAWCNEAGGVFVRMPTLDEVTDEQLHARLAQLMVEVGEFAKEFALDLADDRVSGSELNRMEKELNDVQSVCEELRVRLRKKAGR